MEMHLLTQHEQQQHLATHLPLFVCWDLRKLNGDTSAWLSQDELPKRYSMHMTAQQTSVTGHICHLQMPHGGQARVSAEPSAIQPVY